MRRALVVLAVLAVVVALQATEFDSPRGCPLCGTPGQPLIERDDLSFCQCEKWWGGHNVLRLAVGDCSERACVDGGEPVLRYIDMPLWRCPQDGLLFTEPQ